MIVMVAVGLAFEFVLGVGLGYAIARRDNDDRRRGHVDLSRAAARGRLPLGPR